ncbi:MULTISPECIES: GhoT/OrtT family toxin [Yersinia]|jgi:toxin GhoT|uniref:GhoT/OrtT family toxin n=1 Tax=Yersinia intermedia TaxID=631 RepID=A0ABX6F9M9_YERIN|nr:MULTISPECIES: GhoT/OrtT family toxin [Yersinia]ARB84900.1 GhoT/OrtT family toxin [Yersinia sp. FDAARGOS_228]AVL34692.1 GhoT/OrtT family toxin [Yersinia intermedia]MCB5296841.1 GhoT/OrtT family toxin [Yersinia intermedia]MCW8110187.1 GhoT/OrtT family toxin [Yersinia intermedia]MDA5479055.1 GhoT/OrtT family toxin [Yersinia intermedia]
MDTGFILFWIYVVGVIVSTFIIFPLTRDQSLLVRWLSASLIGITWPLSLPVALLLSMF